MSDELQQVDESGSTLDLRCRGERGDWDFRAKWDGCVDLWRHSNGNVPEIQGGARTDESDYLHLCDIDEMIELLQEVKAKALAKFGDWPG